MTGTAAPARRWLLVEHPGPWGIDAVATAGFRRTVRDQLTTAAGAAGARILLVRRPGRRGQEARDRARAWGVLDHAAGVPAVWGTWQDDGDLLAAVMALDPERAPVGVTHPADEPVLLVCTHARHDTCCAIRGRPVAAALAERWPEWTWECSHVGGDRFAANVVLLPDGAYYGYLDEHSAVDVVGAHLAGRVQAQALRGLSTEPPLAQAAVVAALQRWGPVGARAFRSAALVPQAGGPGDSWQVELVGDVAAGVPARVRATVRRTVRPGAQLTCRATATASAVAYEVRDLREVVPDAGLAG